MSFHPTFLNPTAFAIQGVGVIPFSARGLDIEVQKIANGKIVYDVWGVAHSTARAEFDLFEVKVSCEDIWPPGFVALRKGQLLTVQLDSCFIEPLNGNGPQGGNVQSRPATGDGVQLMDVNGATVTPVDGVAAGAVWQRYAPVLNVMLLDWSFKHNEHGAVTSWSLHLMETN